MHHAPPKDLILKIGDVVLIRRVRRSKSEARDTLEKVMSGGYDGPIEEVG